MSTNGTGIQETPPAGLQPNELKLFLQGLHSDILKDVDTKLIKAIDGLLMELEHRQTKQQNGSSERQKQKLKEMKPEELPAKEFKSRNSTLTDLWHVAHMRSVYNFCLSLLCLLYLNITIFYSLDSEKLREHLSTVAWTFSKFEIVLLVWCGMMGSIVFIMYPAFRFWATSRPISRKASLFDYFFLLLFVVFQLSFLVLPAKAIVDFNIPMVSSFIILAEQSRLLMKSHAFVRENAPRVFQFKLHQDDDDDDKNDSKLYPQPGKLVYFLFAPTLVYRDSYPRTPSINWNRVAMCFLQILGCVLCGYIPVTHFIVDTFKKFGQEPMPLVKFMSVLAVSIFAGGLLMLLIFYGMFHCWLNAFAEMLRFADRQFYDDWWNCTSFGKFYRSWNMVVYDWLYSYIYRDMYIIFRKNRVMAMLMVFLISGIIHEYILAVCFRFAFPLLFLLFLSFGVVLVFVTRKSTSGAWNVFLWAAMFQGWGLLTVFYSVEWYARINCPSLFDSWVDLIVPRSITCNVVSLTA